MKTLALTFAVLFAASISNAANMSGTSKASCNQTVKAGMFAKTKAKAKKSNKRTVRTATTKRGNGHI